MQSATATVDEKTGLKKIELHSKNGSSCVIYMHGAHVTSWKTSEGKELLFVSKQAVFKPPKAIRGGIPVCFPQFGGFGPLPQHGFARNSEFALFNATSDTATLLFQPSVENVKDFPHNFDLFVRVTVGDTSLNQALEVISRDDETMKFTAALHTYYAVGDIGRVRVEGLSGLEYLDNLRDKASANETEPAVTFSGEVDRIYKQAPQDVKLVDEAGGHSITLQRRNLPDVVVWNPWADKAKAMADFGDEEYKEMVCIEPAVAGSGPVELGPHATWIAQQHLHYEPLQQPEQEAGKL